jgi:hypothetical protein
MRKASKGYFGITFFLIIFAGALFAQPVLIFDVIDAAGNEGGDISAPGFYHLSSCIGQPTPVSIGPITNLTHHLYPGFRKVDLDLRYPFSWLSISVRYSADTSFIISWSGIDTTIEDGQGWGLWNYDVQYRLEGSGVWNDWLIGTTDTFGVFGSEIPVDVHPGSRYYFRLRATDLARNSSPWGDQDSMIVDWTVQFCIYTVAPGVVTDALNYATIEYQSQPGVTETAQVWEGSCVNIWCWPNSYAAITGLTSVSDGTQRWSVDHSTTDTSWAIDGITSSYNIPYWHQFRPVIHLEGTDETHTVRTLHHDQFGSGHLESGLFGNWSQWTDYGSLLEFIDSTTGEPVRHAEIEDSVRFHNIRAFFVDTIRYSHVGHNIRIMTNLGDSVSADGVWYSSPYNTNWFAGSSHQFGVRDTYFIHSGEAHIFMNWNDGSLDTARNIVVETDSIFVANFSKNYRVWIENPLGRGVPAPPVGAYWYVAGDTATGTMDTSGVSGWWIVGYYGTGSALSGGGNSFWFEVNDSSRITWRWAEDTGILCTLQVYSRYGHPAPIGEYIVPYGTHIYCSVEDSTFEDGDWHHCTGWLGDGAVVPATGTENILDFVITGSGWLVWQWDGSADLPLYIASSPGVHGPPNPGVGVHWVPIFSLVDAYVENNPDDLWWCIGNISWGSMASSSADSVYFIIEEPTGIDWQWLWWDGPLDTLWIFSRFGDPFPSRGRHIYPAGVVNIIAWVNTPIDEHYCNGWHGDGSVPATGDTNWVTFLLDTFSTLTWDWDDSLLHPFNVASEGGLGDPEPPVGVHWFDPGTRVNAFVENPYAGFYCVGFNGFGNLPPFGYEDSVSFVITRATGVEWLWDDDAFSLLVTAPAYTSPIPPRGVTWHPYGRVIEASIEDSVYLGEDIRHYCRGWSGFGSVPIEGDSNHFEFTVSSNSSLFWSFQDQYRLQLAHAGLPFGVEPSELREEGWYSRGDTAVLVTDSIVWDGDDPYVFTSWDIPGATIHGELNAESTFVIMLDAYTATAYFGQVHWVQIFKDPPEDTLGWIAVDGDTFFNTSVYEAYWLSGRVYDFEVSPLDSTLGVKYEFTGWRDDSTASRVRALNVVSDTIFNADYNTYYHIIVGKQPIIDTLGWMIVDADTFFGDSSAYLNLWWLKGTEHYLEASETDSGSYLKFEFQNWNVSTPTPDFTSDPITSPDTFIAVYSVSHKCHAFKDPRQPYGYLEVFGDRFDGVHSVDFWVEDRQRVPLGVASFDIGPDSVYMFQFWDAPGGGTDTSFLSSAIMGPDTFRAVFSAQRINLDIEFGQHGIFPNDSLYWSIPESLDLMESAIMPQNDSIKVYNMGNVPAEMGLGVAVTINITAGWILDTLWQPSFYAGNHRFVLLARFDRVSSSPPLVWSPVNDYLKTTNTWATATHLGPSGFNIRPAGLASSTDMLWLKFTAPSRADHPHHTRMIVIRALARIYLP